VFASSHGVAPVIFSKNYLPKLLYLMSRRNIKIWHEVPHEISLIKINLAAKSITVIGIFM